LGRAVSTQWSVHAAGFQNSPRGWTRRDTISFPEIVDHSTTRLLTSVGSWVESVHNRRVCNGHFIAVCQRSIWYYKMPRLGSFCACSKVL